MNSRKLPTMKHYRSRNFWEWCDKLFSEDFLRIYRKSEPREIYSLRPPLQIMITSQVVSRLKRRYRPNREIGGIFLAEPVKIGSINMLLINRLRFIKNISKDPRKYQPKGDRTQYMHKCLMGTKKRIRSFPVWFHSHTRKSKHLSEAMKTFFAMSTSDADKKTATKEITYQVDGRHITFAFPSALTIVTCEEETFVGIYGGLLAPVDFQAYVRELLGKSAQEIIKLGFDGIIAGILDGEPVIGILGGLSILSGLAFGFISAGAVKGAPIFRALATRVALIRKEMNADPNYFSTSEGEDLKIIIPRHSQRRVR